MTTLNQLPSRYHFHKIWSIAIAMMSSTCHRQKSRTARCALHIPSFRIGITLHHRIRTVYYMENISCSTHFDTQPRHHSNLYIY